MSYKRNGGGQRPSNEWRGAEICDKQQAKKFCLRVVPSQRTEGLHKNMVNEDVCAILPTGSLLPLFTSNVSDELKSRRRLHDRGRFSSSRGHNERPSWKLEQNRSCSNEKAPRVKKPESERLCVNTVPNICTFAVVFSVYWPSALHSLTPLWFAIQCLTFKLSFLLQDMLQVSKYWLSRDKVWNIPWTTSRKTEPQAGGHVTGFCRRSISRPEDFLLSLPTEVLSLPLAAPFFKIFSRPAFHAAPQLTERLEETS